MQKLDTPNVAIKESANTELIIVGIGASAGGLEAIEQFFSQTNPNSGMAFIIVQHLSDQYKSFMPELLARHTEMTILRAEDGMEIKPNHIYLNPPRSEVTVEKGKLCITRLENKPHYFFPINSLFSSLAIEKKDKAIGIVLSGNGTDGTNGVKEIHEAGGVILTQSKDTAKFLDMPRNAEETGFVDFIMAPAEMPKFLQKYNSYRKIKLEDTELEKIYRLIKDKCGVDFSLYKQSSVIRRIERRVNLFSAHCTTLKDYRDYLEKNPNEIVHLQHDLLIGVTHFFRDPDAFEILKKEVIPQIFQQKRKNCESEIRIWVAGCSTGQEAYSLAILFKEYMDEVNEDFNIRIFATDLDKNAIKVAMSGIYPESIVSSLSKTRLANNFEKHGDNFKVKKRLRDLIVFAPHNIAKDSPFVHMDFISCRNMMIYFQPELQKKILSLFHFSLNKNGFLFLGPSETIGKLSHLYEAVHSKWKIFKCVESSEWDMSNTFSFSNYTNKGTTSSHLDTYTQYVNSKNSINTEKPFQSILETYTTPCLIVNEEDQVVVTGGKIEKYLKGPISNKNSNILRMVQTDLSVAIGTALKKVRGEQKQVHYPNVPLKIGKVKREISLTVKPLTFKNFVIVLLDEIDPSEKTSPPEVILHQENKSLNQSIIELEEELFRTQQHLQTIIEELETSNEELQSTNEELIAANEELQSTNEELQSVNEELLNVNNEYHLKISELTDLTNDMDNLLISTNIATVFLDKDLRVKRFTPEATKVINLLEIDIGRPFFHISNNLQYDTINEDANVVLSTAKRIEREVKDRLGNWYSVRIMPYRTSENFIRGVVMTFIDITQVKKVSDDLKVTSFALEQSPANILIADTQGKLEYANQQFLNTFNFITKDIINQDIIDLYQHKLSVPDFPKIWNIVNKGKQWSGELVVTDKDGNKMWESVSFTPIADERGQQIQILRIAEDITVRKEAEAILKNSEILTALGQLAAGIAHEIRNPLTSLKGFLQLMDEGKNYSQTYGEIMLSEFERIESIVSELLLLARPQDVKYEYSNVDTIVKNVLLLLETQANMKSIEIRKSIPSNLPQIRCVENELKQVIINIVKNAIEATPEGGQITVSISVDYDDTLKIEIIDSGVGIPKERLDKIGQPFYTTKEKGTGLGLMVSFKIIENHAGKMTFISEPEKGTTVTIRLPIYTESTW